MVEYTEEQIEAANNVDLVSFFRKKGRNLIPLKDGYYTISDQRGIKFKGNCWIWGERCLSGHSVDYLTNIEGMKLQEAVEALLSD